MADALQQRSPSGVGVHTLSGRAPGDTTSLSPFPSLLGDGEARVSSSTLVRNPITFLSVPVLAGNLWITNDSHLLQTGLSQNEIYLLKQLKSPGQTWLRLWLCPETQRCQQDGCLAAHTRVRSRPRASLSTGLFHATRGAETTSSPTGPQRPGDWVGVTWVRGLFSRQSQ